MFVYAGSGETDGPLPISNKEFYKKVANQCTALLSTYTAEGSATAWICACGRTARWARFAFRRRRAPILRETRARLGKADADQGARGGGRPGARARAAGIRRAADLPHLPRFPAVEAVSETRQRITEKMAARRLAIGRRGREAGAAAEFGISSFWCSACSGCMAGGSRGCATAAP